MTKQDESQPFAPFSRLLCCNSTGSALPRNKALNQFYPSLSKLCHIHLQTAPGCSLRQETSFSLMPHSVVICNIYLYSSSTTTQHVKELRMHRHCLESTDLPLMTSHVAFCAYLNWQARLFCMQGGNIKDWVNPLWFPAAVTHTVWLRATKCSWIKLQSFTPLCNLRLKYSQDCIVRKGCGCFFGNHLRGWKW